MCICRKCNSRSVKKASSIEMVLYRGCSLPFSVEYSICEECKYEFTTTNQIKNNEVRLTKDRLAADYLVEQRKIKQKYEGF